MTAYGAWLGLAAYLVAASLMRPTPAEAGQTPSLLLTLPGTPEPMGFLSRRDGGVPEEAAANKDRIACLSDARKVPVSEIRRLLAMARRDKAEAYRATARAVAACMEAKGWITVICDGPDSPGCDAAEWTASDDPEAFE